MKKALTVFLSLLLLLACVGCSGGGTNQHTVEEDMAAGSENFTGSISVHSASLDDLQNTNEFVAEIQVSGSAKDSRLCLKFVKMSRSGDYKNAAYTDFEKSWQAQGGEFAEFFTREALQDGSGRSYVGKFEAVLFEKTGDDYKCIAKQEFSIEPVPSSYTKKDDFSGIIGSNYVRSSAVNPLHMWIEYDAEEVEKDLFYAKALGINSIRVFLSPDAYRKDKSAFMRNVEHLLSAADENGMTVIVVFFDDCHQSDKELCYDFTPVFSAAKKWNNSPFPEDRKIENYDWFHDYVCDVMNKYKTDKRVLAWDIWNEPWWASLEDGVVNNLGIANEWQQETEDLLKNAYSWAREIGADQPIFGMFKAIGYTDADCRHSYGPPGTTTAYPELDTLPITENTIYTEAGNRVFGTADHSCTSPNEWIYWLEQRRAQGLPTPGVFLAWELVNSMTMMNYASTPNGIDDPPTVSSGLIMSDGSPCYLSEVHTIRNYLYGENMALLYESFESRSLDQWVAERGDWKIEKHEQSALEPLARYGVIDLVAQNTEEQSVLYSKKDGMSDYYIESTVKIKNFNAKGAGLLLRYDGAGNGYLVRLTINDVSVCKLSGGKLTVLDSVEFGIDDKLWTGWRNLLRVSICGNEIKVYLNPYSFDADVKDPSKKNPSSTREPILTVKDDTYASGRVGFYAHGAMAQFDDFIVMDYELAQREVFGRVYQKGES